jgi:hypothetical protein
MGMTIPEATAAADEAVATVPVEIKGGDATVSAYMDARSDVWTPFGSDSGKLTVHCISSAPRP